MEIDNNSKFVKRMKNYIQCYNHEKYWKMRNEVINPNSKTPKIIKLFYLFRIKRMDAFNNASFGTNINSGAVFQEPPFLPHGPNGIIVHPRAKIGRGSTIHQQVTIGKDTTDPPKIGDNMVVGAGAKIIGNIKIGNNVIVGANCVVVKDVPDNCTVVGIPARIVKLNGKKVNLELKEYWLQYNEDRMIKNGPKK